MDQLGDDWYGQIEKVLGSPPNFAYYQEATRVVYESLWEHSLEESEIREEKEDINITEAIKSIILDCLDPSENIQDSSQGTPPEITSTHQHDTIFYK